MHPYGRQRSGRIRGARLCGDDLLQRKRTGFPAGLQWWCVFLAGGNFRSAYWKHDDLCGIIELQSDRVLQELARALEVESGELWGHIQSDRTGKQASYIEEFGFLWREGKVRIASGHVGNVADFPRTHRHQPYLATFRSGTFDFRFLLIHTRWTTEADRAAEVAQIARDFHGFQHLTAERDVILAGDFNYPSDSPKMGQVRNLPDSVNLIPAGTKTTLKESGEGFSSGYDHLYVNTQATREGTGKGSAYDFVAGLGYTDTQQARSEISDHLPVWAEFRIDGPDDD